jgi:AAA15 family ATPase/GTPase
VRITFNQEDIKLNPNILFFKVENFKSIDSLEISTVIPFEEANVFSKMPIDDNGNFRIRSLCLFGPNGSGKSATISSLKMFWSLLSVGRTKFRKFNQSNDTVFQMIIEYNHDIWDLTIIVPTKKNLHLQYILLKNGDESHELSFIKDVIVQKMYFIGSRFPIWIINHLVSDPELQKEFAHNRHLVGVDPRYTFKSMGGEFVYKFGNSLEYKSYKKLSRGTRKAVALTLVLTWAKLHGGIVIVDDLDSNIWHNQFRNFLETFRHQENGQLIFSSNNQDIPNLLNHDQILITSALDDGSIEISKIRNKELI